MTKFENRPFEKIIVKNLVHEDVGNLIHHTLSDYKPEVFWINGILISVPRLMTSGAGAKEFENMVNGIQYFKKMVFAKLPKYVPSITQNGCGKYVKVLDYSNNNKFKELANWIESQPIWKTIPEPYRGGVKIDE